MSMTQEWSVQRIATPDGAMLADPGYLGSETIGVAVDEDAGAAAAFTADIFSPDYWAKRGALGTLGGSGDGTGASSAGSASRGRGAPIAGGAADTAGGTGTASGGADPVRGGRGSAWFIASGERRWVLRHYRRGGFAARWSTDRYVWLGEERVRAFAEWRLLKELVERGLPVPVPIAARYNRAGLLYRCDLITRRIDGAEPLSSVLAAGAVGDAAWREVGRTVARFHAAGVDHADLNAHNILIDKRGAVSLIDFDRGRMRGAQAGWAMGNLARLERSLQKIARALPAGRFSVLAWREFMAGYALAL